MDYSDKLVRRPDSGSGNGLYAEHKETPPAHSSERLVAQLNEQWRVVDGPLQWVLQRGNGKVRNKSSGSQGRSFCRTRVGLLRCISEYCGEVDANSVAKLKTLPDYHLDRESAG